MRRIDLAGQLGEVRVDYSPQSYIGVRRGRRVWAPLWMLRDGARMYLPDPDGSREEEPSIAFEYFHERLASVGIDITWSSNYNAGSNPISLALRGGDLDKPEVMELLLASFQALEAGSIAWSEQRGSKTDAAAPVSADGEKQAPTTKD